MRNAEQTTELTEGFDKQMNKTFKERGRRKHGNL